MVRVSVSGFDFGGRLSTLMGQKQESEHAKSDKASEKKESSVAVLVRNKATQQEESAAASDSYDEQAAELELESRDVAAEIKISIEVDSSDLEGKLDDLAKKVEHVQSDTEAAHEQGNENREAIAALTKEFRSVAAKLSSSVTAGEETSADLRSKFKTLAANLGALVETVEGNGEQLQEVQETSAATLSKLDQLSQKVDRNHQAVNERLTDLESANTKQHAATRDHVDEGLQELGSRFDSRFAEVDSRLDDSDAANAQQHAQTRAYVDQRVDELEADIDGQFTSLAQDVEDGFAAVDQRFDDLESNLTDDLQNVQSNLEATVSDLKDLVSGTEIQYDTKLSDKLSALKAEFNSQIAALKEQHEEEMAELMSKLGDVTTQLTVLSEQSADTISTLEDKLGSLGNRFGTLVAQFNVSSGGQSVSLGNINLFQQAARMGGEALDKLMSMVGPETNRVFQQVQAGLMATQNRMNAPRGFSLMA